MSQLPKQIEEKKEKFEDKYSFLLNPDKPDSLVRLEFSGDTEDLLSQSYELGREEALREISEKVEELGHQQDDDTIWCNMDEILKFINSQLPK